MTKSAALFYQIARWFRQNEPGTPVPEWCNLGWPLYPEFIQEAIQDYERELGPLAGEPSDEIDRETYFYFHFAWRLSGGGLLIPPWFNANLLDDGPLSPEKLEEAIARYERSEKASIEEGPAD